MRRAILLVEDDPMIGLDEADALERAGCTVVGPHTRISDAFDALARGGIDAAVLDVTIGDTQVYSLADRLGDLKIPFLFVTGYEAGNIPPRFGDRIVITKPFNHKDLIAKVDGLLQG